MRFRDYNLKQLPACTERLCNRICLLESESYVYIKTSSKTV